MKKLQNNYTTPEQSKRLLELGVPADSADMYYHKEIGFTSFYSEPEVIPSCELFSTGNPVYIHDIPCWSVGRLIEIYHICVGPGCSFTFHVCFPNLMNEIIYKIAEAKSNGWLNLDKLEDDENR